MSACTAYTGVKITVGHQPKTDQFSKIATHFLVWSDIFQIKEAYTVVLTCVVGVANITFSVAWRGSWKVRIRSDADTDSDMDTSHFKIHFCIYITVNIHTYFC